MKNQNDALNILGLARKAGKLVLGTTATEHALKRGRVKALIFAKDVAENTKKKLEPWTRNKKIPIFYLSNKQELGRQFNRESVGVLGLLDSNFNHALKKHLG